MITADALFSPAVIMDAREPSASMTYEWGIVRVGITPLLVSFHDVIG
jgi:kynureninase